MEAWQIVDCETKPEAETEDIPEVRRDVLKVEVGWQGWLASTKIRLACQHFTGFHINAYLRH